MANNFGLPNPFYTALFILLASVLIIDYRGLRRCNSLEPDINHHAATLSKLSCEINKLDHEVSTLRCETRTQLHEHATSLDQHAASICQHAVSLDQHAASLDEHTASIDQLHRAVDSLKFRYNELRLLIGVWDKTSMNPAVGAFHTGEVRRMDRSDRHTSKMISFEEPYPQRPGIPVALMWLDIGNNKNVHVKCYSSNIEETYFEINIDTWSGTQLYQASCAWLEVGEHHQDFQYGMYSTLKGHPQMSNSRKIIFARSYSAPPKMVVWLNSLDMRRDRNWRVRTYASDITATDFIIHIDTWGDSELYSAGVSWVSYTSDIPGVFSGSISTSDPDPSRPAQLSTSGYVEFNRDIFDFPPRAILGINSFDIDCDRNLRLAVRTMSVQADGMSWRLNSWGDTKLYSAGASFIALS